MARKRRSYMDSETYYEEKDDDKNGSPVIEETKSPTTKRGIVCNAQHVRVRKEPSGTSTTLKVLDRGDEVTILGQSTETFYQIDLGDDCIGYISCNYCEEVT